MVSCVFPAQQIDNGLMVGNSQVIFEKAESSSLTLVGEFLYWAQFDLLSERMVHSV